MSDEINKDENNGLLDQSDLEELISEKEKDNAGFNQIDESEHEGVGLNKTDKSIPKKNLQKILTMKIPVIVKIAEKKMRMENILKLNLGSIIQFDKDAYQLIDLMVNNQTIGLGQPIKIGEKFGLQVTHIGDINEKIRILGHKE